ncbi:MAG: hypothetical protein OEM97_01290 [Acidimicrobiia bacterium]|nr:hypothetical protein [Acidimicrobiia bacterium]
MSSIELADELELMAAEGRDPGFCRNQFLLELIRRDGGGRG